MMHMPRPFKPRCIDFDPSVTYFKPRAIPFAVLEEITLKADELEALRLCDLNELDQMQAAKKLKVSRSTFQRILSSARMKVSKALVEGKAIRIEKQCG